MKPSRLPSDPFVARSSPTVLVLAGVLTALLACELAAEARADAQTTGGFTAEERALLERGRLVARRSRGQIIEVGRSSDHVRRMGQEGAP